MTWFRNTRYGSLTGSHAQITHMMWRQSVHVIQKSGMQVECGSHRGLELLELERVERGCMWDRMMLMMTSMGLFLSFEGIGNSVQGGCGLDRQMAI